MVRYKEGKLERLRDGIEYIVIIMARDDCFWGDHWTIERESTHKFDLRSHLGALYSVPSYISVPYSLFSILLPEYIPNMGLWGKVNDEGCGLRVTIRWKVGTVTGSYG